MENVFLAVGMLCFGCAAVLGLVAWNIYSGVHGNLANARVGEVYNFKYEQPLHGEPERYMAKVLSVHTLNEEDIARLNAKSKYRRYDTNFVRTRHLVTAQSHDGTVRNFYAERTTDVRRPLLGGVVFKSGLAAMFF